MSDSGKININADFSKPNLPKAQEAAPTQAPKAEVKKSSNKNDIYKSSSDSQNTLIQSGDAQVKPDNGQKLDFDIRHKNPILYESLKNRPEGKEYAPKEKKPAPEPSLRVKLSPKGYAINPRKVKPNVPGRLKSFPDLGFSNMDRLSIALGDQIGVNLKNLIADNLLKDYMTNFKSDSIADLLDLNAELFNQDLDFVKDFLSAKAELLAEDQFLYDFLQGIVQLIDTSPNPLAQILQLFLPFPLPYILKDIDLEFEEDEKEVLKDCADEEEDAKSGDEEEEADTEDEAQGDNEISISVTTKNFNKMHFLVRFPKDSSEAKIYLKGDITSSELSVPVEMAIDESLYGAVENIDFFNSLWQKQTRLNSEERYLKIRHSGNLDSKMVDVTRAILMTVADNDIAEDRDDELI